MSNVYCAEVHVDTGIHGAVDRSVQLLSNASLLCMATDGMER